MSDPMRPIRPELLAAKIEKIENFDQPRLLEEFGENPRLVRALWLLQWISQPSNYAGGLSKFAAELIVAKSDQIGTQHMLKVGAVDHYKVPDAVKILRELPATAREELLGVNTSLFEEAFLYGLHERRDELGECRKEWEPLLIEQMNPAALRSLCTDYARLHLAEYFKELCELPHVSMQPHADGNGAPWYFVAIAEALLAFIDARAEQLRSRLAETEVTKEIRRWISKSRSMQRPVMFIGNSRFGKTEAIKLEATADPGDCRLVNTPESNVVSDLLREVAKSLGIEVGPQNSGRELRERTDYVLRFSKLQLIFDESQFLLPGNYSRNTAPARLNWVRRSIMDQGIAAVFVCTPQSYFPAKRRFVKTTGFAMEQFDERILKTVQLPEELAETDLLAVARIHFPESSEVSEEYLGLVMDKVVATERNFVSDMEKIATLAKDNAREHGRDRPILCDIEAAIADVLPTVAKAVTPAQKMRQNPSSYRPCKPAAEALPMPRRGLENLDRDGWSRPAEVPA